MLERLSFMLSGAQLGITHPADRLHPAGGRPVRQRHSRRLLDRLCLPGLRAGQRRQPQRLLPELRTPHPGAQASGLPGAYPNGTPLTRLTDAALRQSNGDTACPQASSGGYPRPTGYSCDEYPFRSTWQGAFTSATPPNPGRTFDWCQISALPQGVTGPNGWSACMIPATENSNAGSQDLRVFYNDNRVIEQDPFFVWIVD
ncbi:hypothetical protein ACI2L1_15760 [Streptomyces sp. NPDC019531]|uniref:NucA/NucB deoxyribonuclease domain-containing protein n=1 Tax=Streptomyces sp. NPDC019531 TaxID=3365062 RepID=UPI00384AD4A5